MLDKAHRSLARWPLSEVSTWCLHFGVDISPLPKMLGASNAIPGLARAIAATPVRQLARAGVRGQHRARSAPVRGCAARGAAAVLARERWSRVGAVRGRAA